MKNKKNSAGIVQFAIDYPYFILVACLILSLLGGLAIQALPKDLLPASNQPAVQILSFYPGMPVDNVEKDLTTRFERYTAQAIGMAHQESRSLSGVTIIRNFFNPEISLDNAIAQTTSLVMSVLRKLPPGTQPPLILPFDPMASVPLALVAVSGDFPEKTLVDLGRYEVGNAVQAIPGAMAPTVMGGTERQIIVYLDPNKLKTYNFSPLDILNRMTQLNTFIPTGDVKIGKLDYQILSNGLADRVSDMNSFPLRSENGVTVPLSQVGEARDAAKIQTNIVMVDGKRQVYVPIYRQPGANSIRVVDQVKQAMEKLESRLHGFTLKVVADQSTFIRHAIESIAEETLIGGGLAALMVFLFLGNPRATFGILLSIPLSLFSAFLGLKASGQTLNAMTLGGLALSIGVLVDNSIVVLENISRKQQEGLSPLQAALEGGSEVAMPVLASTLSTLVVLFPVVFFEGISKTLFSALAKSVTFAMIGSYLTAMTVIPLFASKFIRQERELPQILKKMQQLLENLSQMYGELLRIVLNKKKILFSAITFILLLGCVLAPQIGTELFPRADAGNLILKVRLPSGTRIEESEAFAKEMNTQLKTWIPASDLSMIITNIGLIYGFPAAYTPNAGTQDMFFNIELTADRTKTSQYYAQEIRKKIADLYPHIEIGIELGGLLTSALNGGLSAPIDIQFEGPDLREASQLATQLAGQIKSLKGSTDIRIQQRFDSPQLNLEVDRKEAGKLGLTVDEVMKNVVSSVSSSTSFNPSIWVDPKSGIDYLFGVQFHESDINNFEELMSIPLTGRHQERSIPLRRIATLKKSTGPNEVHHENLSSVIDLYLDAQGRDIGSLSRSIQKLIQQTQFPKGYSASIRGEIKEMQSAVSSLQSGFILSAILVYLILVIQFKSFKLPAIVMGTIPIGVVGIILMLVSTHTYFSIQAAIGGIFMIGIAVANGVLLIEFILHQTHDLAQRSLDSAIIMASQARLRPILMTSLASILGLVPMAIGLGHGSEANIPLGRAVIGGQIFSTLLTLFLVPVLFKTFWKKGSES